jgi:hypothetical protein
MSYFNNVNDLVSEIQIEGAYRGRDAKVWQILGRRSKGWNSTSAFGDVAGYLDTTQSLLNPANGATMYYLNSTSVNDVAGSAGISKVRIVYLDVNGDVQVTEKTLNGTTAVNIGAGYYHILWMETSVLGTGIVAAGDVTIDSTNGAATTATTIEMILAGGNRSMSGRAKIPTGYTGYILDWCASSSGGTGAYDARLRADVFSDDRALSAGIFHFQSTMQIGNGTGDQRTLPYLKYLASAEVKVSAIPTQAAAENRLDANLSLILIANP